jgi:hypothetical protein
MRYRSTWILTWVLLTAACKPTVPVVEPAAAAPPAVVESVASPAPVAAPSVETAFTKKMPYAELRKRLTDAGWLPLRDPICRENVGGEALVCGELPEVESCSGDGHCVMHFANADEGERIRVTTYGSSERWNTPGEEAAFAVTSWSISALEPVVTSIEGAAPACPSRDFNIFLKAFASDNRISQAFTSPVVKVGELYSGDNGDRTRMVYVAGGIYDGFNVEYAAEEFHFVDSVRSMDRKPLHLEIEVKDAAQRYVRYMYGASEGNSYMFRMFSDCWYLTEDPEPPGP